MFNFLHDAKSEMRLKDSSWQHAYIIENIFTQFDTQISARDLPSPVRFITMIGKRKRESVVVRKTSQSVKRDELDGAYDVLRQHFEATFEPIPQPNPVSITDDVEEDASEEASQHSDWSGLSDDGEDTPSVQVVEHAQAEVSAANSSRATEFKAFMVGPPPHGFQIKSLNSPTEFEASKGSTNHQRPESRNRLRGRI